MKRVLVTGGAGFIGSHVVDCLLDRGYEIRVLDNLCQQVHPTEEVPDYLSSEVEFVRGDIRDAAVVERALKDVDAVVHLAAAVGVGQSMYELEHYTDVNTVGTAVLLKALMDRPVERLVVASSMSIYGEGLYEDENGKIIDNAVRSVAQLEKGDWEIRNGSGAPLSPLVTPETKQAALPSVYALSKYDQERLCLIFGQAYNVPTVALRFFNAYGPRQALSNPYTGVLAIFASRLLNDHPPLIFEDGKQRRDFVSVYDICQAVELALERPQAVGNVYNVGSGQSMTVSEVARGLAKVLGKPIEPEISGRCRIGDIRHCYGDISAARRDLGYEPRHTFESGVQELAAWLEGQTAEDRAAEARDELMARGLTI